MLTWPPAVRLYVAPGPVDARKGIDGLSLYVQAALQKDPLSGHLFVFFNRRRDLVSLLYWDRSGYVLCRKRLERGRFRLPPRWTQRGACAHVEAAELQLVLEGLELGGARRRPRWTPQGHSVPTP